MRQNGFTFDPKSVDSLTGALLALEADAALRQSMGQASRSIVADYSCDRFAKSALLAAKTAMARA
jgi:glycosyltransferase involved in cell wall biosynthesis